MAEQKPSILRRLWSDYVARYWPRLAMLAPAIFIVAITSGSRANRSNGIVARRATECFDKADKRREWCSKLMTDIRHKVAPRASEPPISGNPYWKAAPPG